MNGPPGELAQLIQGLEPMLMTANDEASLLRGVLEAMSMHPGIDGGWIGHPGHDGQFRIDCAVGAMVSDFLALAALRMDDGPMGSGPAGLAWRSGQTSIVTDWATDARAEPWRALPPGWGSSVTLPLQGEMGTQGVLVLYSRRADTFTPTQEMFLTHFGQMLGLALSRCRTQASAQAYACLLDAIVRTHEGIDPDADEAAIADRFVGILYDSGLFPILWVAQVAGDGDLGVIAGRGVTDTMSSVYLEAKRVAAAKGATMMIDRVIESGQSMWTDDYLHDPVLQWPGMQAWREHVTAIGMTQIAMSPIYVSGRLWGVLVANGLVPNGTGQTLDFKRLLPLLERGAGTLGTAIERYAREHILHETLSRLDLESRAIAAAQQGISIADMRQPGQPLIFVNPAFTQITGYTAAEVLGNNGRLLQSKGTDAAARRRLREAITSREPVTVVLENRRKDGTIFWNEVSLSPVISEGGELTHYIGLQSDVTDRVREESYRRQMTSVVECMQEGIVLTDADLHILNVNPAFTQITGYGREEVLGQTPALLRSDRHGQDFYDAMALELSESGCWQGEIWNRRRNGEVYPEILSISAVRDSQGVIRHYAGVFTDITGLKEREQALQQAATCDFLTGLPNRFALDQHLEACLPRALRQQTLLAIGLLDLDGFKAINDTYGHDIGDMLLRQLAARLRQILRSSDFLARLGGDEFVLLMEDIRRWSDVELLLERVGAVFDAPFRVGEHEVDIGASLGLTLYPLDESRPRDLLRHADHALYAAKGRDRIRSLFYALYAYNPEAHETAEHTSDPTSLPSPAKRLAPQDLEVYYQPVFDLPSQTMNGVEALARLHHREGTWGPDDFLSHLTPVDVRRTSFVVLDQALAQLRRWDDEGLSLDVSVNFEPLDLLSPSTALALQSRLEAHDVDPARLTIEIIDSGKIFADRAMKERLEAIKALGVGLALDDLGGVYASLEQLRGLPFDSLKLDRTFGIGLDRRPSDLRFLLSLIDLAQSLGVSLVVEGIDSAESLAAVQALGVTRVQGYFLAPPMAGEGVPRLRTEASAVQASDPLIPAYAGHLIWVRGLRSRLQGAVDGWMASDESPMRSVAARLPGLCGLLDRYPPLLADTAASTLPPEAAVLLIDTVEREIMHTLDKLYEPVAAG
ncbi:hypothetical protein BI364_03090 [Acidihalobacter yilgarnensis]|uniref:Diguanylate cyclase n=1 Tax=Acidihalobacter yilgarnensis TaxID=2819280 RepID=A0A1D8IL54_9GAMM|nr:EAL domain-containing protein [Acidihalobacter yilgarnensis]AOU97121.1 hypothetical protein BI364_03090 [Acidihalobacter yilgarnensis]